VVRAWLNPDGTVEQVSFDTLKDARADVDLRPFLTRGNFEKAGPVSAEARRGPALILCMAEANQAAAISASRWQSARALTCLSKGSV
jgi:hypothetical protein